VHKVGAEDSDVLLELGQDGLADAEFLEGFFVGAGEQVLVMRKCAVEKVAHGLREREMHRIRPISCSGDVLPSG
jgi:hypothetical protein